MPAARSHQAAAPLPSRSPLLPSRPRVPLLVLACVIAPLFVLSTSPVLSSENAPVQGLDHVPVAVADLQKAGERYRSLGFTLKPGRPHTNGIANLHAKFSDHTEIELITAPQAVDELTTTYREHLKGG